MKIFSHFPVTIILINILNFTPLLMQLGFCNSDITEPKHYTFSIVKEFPHDPKAFTQGLVWDNGNIYEATGLYGQSSLRRVDLHSGKVELKLDYDQKIFAEGITIYKDKIYQLTLENRVIFQYSKHNFTLIRAWDFPYEGWGITHDNKLLIVSDGTEKLYFFDPKTLEEKRRILVHDSRGWVDQLNELEYINGMIYANIWKTDRIAIIDPKNGAIKGYLDLSGLPNHMNSEKNWNVLNGIMYDPLDERLFVTGKLWPSLFEIKILPKGAHN